MNDEKKMLHFGEESEVAKWLYIYSFH